MARRRTRNPEREDRSPAVAARSGHRPERHEQVKVVALRPAVARARRHHRRVSALPARDARRDGGAQLARRFAAGAPGAGNPLRHWVECRHLHRHGHPLAVPRRARRLLAGPGPLSPPSRGSTPRSIFPSFLPPMVVGLCLLILFRRRLRAVERVLPSPTRSPAWCSRSSSSVRPSPCARCAGRSTTCRRVRGCGHDARLLAGSRGVAGHAAGGATRDVCLREHRVGAEPRGVRTDPRLRGDDAG